VRARVLGSAAGGGLPQWNCACEGCQAARRGEIPPRTQSSIAVTADGERWLLINASPDVRAQVQAFAPTRGRGSRIAAIALTSADIDHAAGLLVLREGGPPPLYATREVEDALGTGLGILRALPAYGPVDVRRLEPGKVVSFADRAGEPLGLEAQVIDMTGKPPPYMRASLGAGDAPGQVVALSLRAPGGKGSLLYAPGVASFAPIETALASASVVLFDGTCFADDDLALLGGKTSRAMGHIPMSGAGGSLARLARLTGKRVYVHINNTNPALLLASPARKTVEAAGVSIGEDGTEIEV
jgi:pyrroloquinoline quinone biosynthesis protein B